VYIGLFGGTFNPLHFGHLRAAEEICDRYRMKEVIFIPSANPPHKNAPDMASPIQRLKMVNLAITGNSRFSVSEVELHRRGKSYSLDTVRRMKKDYPDDELAFIMGMDAFLELDTWYKYEQIVTECDFIVCTRPGPKRRGGLQAIPESIRGEYKKKRGAREFVHSCGKKIMFADITEMGVSGTRIRRMVRDEVSIRYLTPRRVMEYIQENGLYR